MEVDSLSWNIVTEKILQFYRKLWNAPSFNISTLLWPVHDSSSNSFQSDFLSNTSFIFCDLTIFAAVLLDLHHLRAKLAHWVKSGLHGSQWQSSHWLLTVLRFHSLLFKQSSVSHTSCVSYFGKALEPNQHFHNCLIT